MYEKTGEDLFNSLIRRFAKSEVRNWVESLVTQGDDTFRGNEYGTIDESDFMNLAFDIYGFGGQEMDVMNLRINDQAILEQMGLGGGLFPDSISVRVLIDGE